MTTPRTIVLWVPLLVAYWMTIGVRASFFVPSELPAAWTFRANGPAVARAYWSGTRAAMIAVIVPVAALVAAVVTAPLLGWRIAAWHTAFVALMTVAFVELVAITIDAIPFTRPYLPGHAKLKLRWPLYLLGMFAFALWPVRVELRSLGVDEPWLLAYAAAAAIAFHLAGRRGGAWWSVDPREELADDDGHIAVLNISGEVHGAHIGG
jgi:hypothetical protein